jgi:SAM-dependent methyltransferase
VWKFIPAYPSFLVPEQQRIWAEGQRHYEMWDKNLAQEDDYDAYLVEIEATREIYTREFKLTGVVLDVGGHQGRLRHFLGPEAQYLSIDPYASAFDDIEQQTNLLRAYPCLHEPCNFVQAQAERLPIKADSFDYVHMRSVLDHFFDPYLGLCEARRVLRIGGGLIIGLHVAGDKSSIREGRGGASLISRLRKKLRDEGVQQTVHALIRRLTWRAEQDMHIWHPTYQQLKELVKAAHLEIEKVYWQKPPFDHVVYLIARKQ